MVKVRNLSLLVMCAISFCSIAADRIVPVYPGPIIIDSGEQAETEKRVRMQAIEDAKARMTEGANAADNKFDTKPDDIKPDAKADVEPEAITSPKPEPKDE